MLDISLLGVGFSSWLATTTIATAKIDMRVGDVEDYSAIITSISFDRLSYTDLGFIVDETIESQAYFCANVSFNLAMARELISDFTTENSSFHLKFTFQETTSFNYVSQYFSIPSEFVKIVTPSSGVLPTYSVSNQEKQENSLTAEVTFTNIPSSLNALSIKLHYLIDGSKVTDFNASFKSLENCKFNLNVEVLR